MNKIKKFFIQRKIKNWKQEKDLLIKEQQMKEEKNEVLKKQEKRKLSTTKRLTFFLFINCTIIEIFTLYVTLKQLNMGIGVDLTPLQMLITTIVGEVIVFAVYSLKSLKENTKDGIIYQTAMNQYNTCSQENQEVMG